MLNESDLAAFIGTENYYKSIAKNVLYTDGVRYLAENAGAYWLLDAIASYQQIVRELMPDLHEIQFWTLEVKEDRSAVLYCQADSGEPRAIEQQIEFTDFPVKEIKVWVEASGEHMVMLLPSEH